MATLVLENVPDELYQELTAAARRNHRTVDEESLARLRAPDGAQGRPDRVERTLDRLRAVRETLPPEVRALTPEDIDRFKREGRD